jgi:hypothetical protein
MKALRVLAGVLVSWALLGPAWADVRTLNVTQRLTRPPNQTFTTWGQAVAIDGNSILVVAAYEGGQAALLYQNINGKWTYRRVLTSVAGPLVRTSVRMKNGLAAVQFGDAISIFERSGTDYVPGRSAAAIRHPGGLAISGNSILIGGDDCDYDAVVYQKGADGNWGITGRLDDNAGQCQPDGLSVELNYDYALLRAPSSHEAHAWRRNGTALAWVPAGTLTVPPDVEVSDAPFALQNSTAVSPGSAVFRRSGNTWTQNGSVKPLDYANGTSPLSDLTYRDGVLVTTELLPNGSGANPYAYLETSPGEFEHVAILQNDSPFGDADVGSSTLDLDVSGRTVVSASRSDNGQREVAVFVLPTPLKAPPPIATDFENRNLSAFTFTGGQYALATRGTDDVLTQTSGTGLAVALLNDSDWSDLQRIETDIAPIPSGTGGWVGLVARYVDADNYYYVAIRPDNSFGLYRRLNGADTLLAGGSTRLGAQPMHVALTVNDGGIRLQINRPDGSLNDQVVANTTDATLRHGRAGFVTYRARADFDDVHAAATQRTVLMAKNYDSGFVYSRPFTELGGDWQEPQDEDGEPIKLVQLDKSGYAFAITGTPVESQEITSFAGVNSFGGPPEGAWLGMVGRFVDDNNFYYVVTRNSNQLQIRKKLNGVVTTLASVNFDAAQSYIYRFRLVGDLLQVYANGKLVASAHDADIAKGQYGVGTYRAAATWSNITVAQP